MYKGFNKIFWGYLFLTFKINLGPIPILPAFVSWIIIFNGINIILSEKDNENFRRAKALVFFQIFLGLIEMAIGIFQLQIVQDRIFLYMTPVGLVLNLIVYYFILEGSIDFILEMDSYFYSSLNSTLKNIIIFNVIFISIITGALAFLHDGILIFGMILIVIMQIVFIYWVRKVRNRFEVKILEE